MLQNLAATADFEEGAVLDAGESSELAGGDDSGDDEEPGEELEASLAFLSALLTATTPKGSPGEFQSGGGQSRQNPSEDPAPALRNAGPSLSDSLVATDERGSRIAPEGLPLTSTPHELLETRSASEMPQNLARAADLLTPASRGPVAAQASTVLTHARDPRWAEEFGTRVSLLVRAGESTASLQLTPVDLGPVEVNITVKDSQATIQFGASQADTRALIEASLPRLRELLASQGFSLLDASVSSGFSRAQEQRAAAVAAGRDPGEPDAAISEVRPVRVPGLLDVYA
jgi:hypothetical protein